MITELDKADHYSEATKNLPLRRTDLVMKLTFQSAQDLSEDQPSVSYVFLYTINDSTVPHSLHIMGTDRSASRMDEEAQRDYAQKLFSGALFITETLWQQNKQLPDEHHTYRELSDFPAEVIKAIPWQGYELLLSE